MENQNQTLSSHLKSKKAEKSKNSCKSRVITSVSYPETKKLTIDEIFDQHDRPRNDLIKKHFFDEGRLEESAALKIIHDANQILKSERNLIRVSQPVVIVGDLHGQFYDMCKVFELGGSPSDMNYLFLGDYVDRGYFSIEIVLFLWSLKIRHRSRLTLLRGNHECRHLAEHFTFKRECLIKYSSRVYEACLKSFCSLPLCAVVNEQLFCVHGGISPDLVSIKDVNKFNRDREPPSNGLMCDLLWSDPAHDFNDDSKHDNSGYTNNSTRGCSYFYNSNAVDSFIKNNNNLLCLIRAHEAQDNGFRMYRKNDAIFPSVITIFSAPNYLDVYNNKGAILVYEKDTINPKQFTSSTHPYWLPNFMDVFTWSLPFVAEKVTELFFVIYKLNTDDVSAERRAVIRAKLAAISRIAQAYSKIREKSDGLSELKAVAQTSLNSSDGESDSLLGNDFSRKRKLSLEEIKELDRENECLPRASLSK